jgi:SHS2 domain-containing protein
MSFTYPDGGPAGDLLIESSGKSLGEAFANIALGMFNAITPIKRIVEDKEFLIYAKGMDLESLLFNLMDEFLYFYDTSSLVPCKIDIDLDVKDFSATAKCVGEKFNIKIHEPGIGVKAVTYHMMKIIEMEDYWLVRVVFDT